MGSDLEGDLGPDGDLHDGGWSDGRRVCGGGTELREERLVGAGGGGIGRVDGDGGTSGTEGKVEEWNAEMETAGRELIRAVPG